MCIFCKIINNEIPSKKIYEDDDVLAILDISQATKGHTLVLPKKHYSDLTEIEDYEYLKVMSIAKDLSKSIKNTFNASGINLLNNCGETAGQTVMHFHVHIIPRYNNEDIKINFFDHSNAYNLEEIKNSIVSNLDGE